MFAGCWGACVQIWFRVLAFVLASLFVKLGFSVWVVVLWCFGIVFSVFGGGRYRYVCLRVLTFMSSVWYWLCFYKLHCVRFGGCLNCLWFSVWGCVALLQILQFVVLLVWWLFGLLLVVMV